MRCVCLLFGLALLLGTGIARADKQSGVTRAEIEGDLRVEVELVSPAKVRPGEPIQVSALLKNVSKERTHKVIDPGSGCSFGIVEPHVFYTARFLAHRKRFEADGTVGRLKGPNFSGMCGMGDYRWHNRVRDLAPGASLDIGARLSWASASMDMQTPGRYALRVHYAFDRRGTTQKLPQADPVGDLGPMKGSPKFEIVSNAVMIDVVRPIEVFVEPRGFVKKGVARKLSDLVTVRLENWGVKDVEFQLSDERVHVAVREGAVRRKPVSAKTAPGKTTIEPGGSVVLIGPGGFYDEAWAPTEDGPLEISVGLLTEPGSTPLGSHWVRLEGPPAK